MAESEPNTSPFTVILIHNVHSFFFLLFQVVANAVAAISEIMETSQTAGQVLDINSQIINKLLTALNECTEWGQVFILDSIANYTPKDEREAQSICERVTPRLAHANSAVVLSAVKVRESLEDFVYWSLSLLIRIILL